MGLRPNSEHAGALAPPADHSQLPPDGASDQRSSGHHQEPEVVRGNHHNNLLLVRSCRHVVLQKRHSSADQRERNPRFVTTKNNSSLFVTVYKRKYILSEIKSSE